MPNEPYIYRRRVMAKLELTALLESEGHITPSSRYLINEKILISELCYPTRDQSPAGSTVMVNVATGESSIAASRNGGGVEPMSIDFSSAWGIAQHVAEIMAAHGVMATGEAGFGKLRAWLGNHLPAGGRATLEAVANSQEAGPECAALADAIHTMLKANSALLDELRALLQESEGGTGATILRAGDNNKIVQSKGSGNTISIA